MTGPASGAPAAQAGRAAERVARESYGRLLAWLAWRWRDIAAAEDALGEAFAAALATWPRDGVPASPEGWLMTTARNQLALGARRARLADDPTLTVLWPDERTPAPQAPVLPDDRLRLMFVCAHPAIDPAIRSALMLQTVLGLDAARIGGACLVPADAMGKRLSRAKAKIRQAGIRFEEPEARELPLRVQAVLEAIYGAYSLHWGQADAAAGGALASEAHYLAALVVSQLPADAEALGLLALLSACEARREASRDAGGAFVPLERQEPHRWDAALIAQAGDCLQRAAALRRPGPLQLEAAIQLAHASRARTGRTPWGDIAVLYERLLAQWPTIGARIAHAVAISHAHAAPARGLALLDAMDRTAVGGHQPWWAARAYLLEMAGDRADAALAFDAALTLTVDPDLRRHLAARRDAMRRAPAGGR